jgi:hypothetical protein
VRARHHYTPYGVSAVVVVLVVVVAATKWVSELRRLLENASGNDSAGVDVDVDVDDNAGDASVAGGDGSSGSDSARECLRTSGVVGDSRSHGCSSNCVAVGRSQTLNVRALSIKSKACSEMP